MDLRVQAHSPLVPLSSTANAILQLKESFVTLVRFFSGNSAMDPMEMTADDLKDLWAQLDPQSSQQGAQMLVGTVREWLEEAMNISDETESLPSRCSQPTTPLTSVGSLPMPLPMPSKKTTTVHSEASVDPFDVALFRRLASHRESTLSLASQVSRPAVSFTETLKKMISPLDGNKMINQYLILAELGSGTQGKVKLAFDTEKEEYRAIKCVRRTSRLQPRQHEVAVLKKLRHKNIVALHEVIDDEASRKIYLVLQYVENGPLRKTSMVDGEIVCDPVPAADMVNYGRQICSGLRYLHRHGVAHRDIKPDNILLGDDDCVYISDFGVAEIFEEEERDAAIDPAAKSTMKSVGYISRGTPAFFAPELSLDSDDNSNESREVDSEALDVWALGVTFYVLLVGHLPWSSNSDGEYAYRTRSNCIVFPPLLSHQWKSLILGMLTVDPAARLSLEEVRNTIKSMRIADGGDARGLMKEGRLAMRLREKVEQSALEAEVDDIPAVAQSQKDLAAAITPLRRYSAITAPSSLLVHQNINTEMMTKGSRSEDHYPRHPFFSVGSHSPIILPKVAEPIAQPENDEEDAMFAAEENSRSGCGDEVAVVVGSSSKDGCFDLKRRKTASYHSQLYEI